MSPIPVQRNQRTGEFTQDNRTLMVSKTTLTSAASPVRRDEEMDGEWEAPQVANPACEAAPGCGEWKRPVINNPQYKGKWKAPLVDNPNYQVPRRASALFIHLSCI